MGSVFQIKMVYNDFSVFFLFSFLKFKLLFLFFCCIYLAHNYFFSSFERYIFFNNLGRLKVVVLAVFFIQILAIAQSQLPDKRMDFQKKKWTWKEKVPRKVSITPSAGMIFLPQNVPLTSFGFVKNVYAGFPLGLSLGVGAHYSVSGHIFAEAGISALYAKNQYNTLSALALHFGPKLYLFTQKRKFSPYFTIGATISLLRFVEEEHSKIFDNYDKNSSLITLGEVTKVENFYPAQKINIGPVLGAYIGGGLEFRLNNKFSFFTQATFNPTINSQNKAVDFFPNNESQLKYFNVKAGINIKLFKKPPPTIDTNTIYIPDEIAMVDVPESIEPRGMLVREGVFDVLLREGMKHDVRIGVNSHELMIDEELAGPCKVTCYLFDENGEIMATSESTPEGKIVFTDLQKGVYDLAFQLEKPCESANFKYKFPDPSTQVLQQHNSEAMPSDTSNYNIEGFIEIPDTADYSFVYKSSALFVATDEQLNKKNFDVHVMLANADNRVIRHFDPKSDEKFAFKKLPPDNYDVIYKAPDMEMKSGYKYTLFNNYKRPLKKYARNNSCDSLPIEKTEAGENMKYTMRGKVDFIDSLTKAEDVTLYLVNCYKKVVSTRKPESNGSFVFKNLHNKNDYTVFYEIEDNKKKIELLYRIEDPQAMARANNVAALTELKVISGDMQTWNENTEYNIVGQVTHQHGLAIQVGATDNMASVNALCKKLLDDGFSDINIQVLGTENLNKRFSFSKTFKLFRILVGKYENDKTAKKEKSKLDFFGYDAYIVKHFE